MSKMIIATDGSKFGEKAAGYGVSLAKRTGSEVVAVYVINMKALSVFAMGHHDNITGYEDENARMKKEGEEALKHVAAKCKEAGVPVTTRIVRGYPAEEIIKAAVDENAEMIVMGSLGKTGLSHILLGSVSEEVVKKAPCPVLIVRGSI